MSAVGHAASFREARTDAPILPRIRAGGAPLRAALHMAALAAARANPPLKAFRDRLRDKGKPHRLALTAVLRKLVVLANALVRDNRLWTPEPA